MKSVAAPPSVTAHKVIKISDLNNDIAKSVPSSVEPGIDLSVLTQLIRPVEDLIEAEWAEHGAGIVLGGASGRGHMYIDLVLLDGENSMQLLKQALSRSELGKAGEIY